MRVSRSRLVSYIESLITIAPTVVKHLYAAAFKLPLMYSPYRASSSLRFIFNFKVELIIHLFAGSRAAVDFSGDKLSHNT